MDFIDATNENLLKIVSSGNLITIMTLINKNTNKSKLNEALIYACEFGHLPIVKYLLQIGADIHVNQDTPLATSIINEHSEIAIYIIKNRLSQYSNPRYRGMHISLLAVRCGLVDIVQALVENGIDSIYHQDMLREALKQNNFNIIQYLVEEAKINLNHPFLDIPCEKGDLEMVQYLLDHGASNINYMFCNALNCACEKGHLEIVKLLVDTGTEINFKTSIINDPLASACKSGNQELVEYLVTKGININESSGFYIAARCGRYDMVEYLIDNGVNLKKMTSALCHAAENGHYNIVELLLKNEAKIKAKTIHHAAQGGHFDIIKLLIENDGDPNAYPGGCWTPHHYPIMGSAICGRIDILEYLIDHGADLHISEDYIVVIAAKYGHLPMLKYLKSMGANLHTQQDEALIKTIEYGNYHVVKYLIDEGANVNIHGFYSPLTEAARQGYLNIVKLLIQNGANIYYEFTTIRLVIENGYFEILKYLESLDLDRMFNYTKALKIAIKYQQIEIVDYLISLKEKIKYDEYKILKTATSNQHHQDLEDKPSSCFTVDKLIIMKRLIEGNFDINATNGKSTALIAAIKHDSDEIAEYLIMEGADIHFQNDKALSVAYQCCCEKIAKLLIKRGANFKVIPEPTSDDYECFVELYNELKCIN